MVRRGVVEKVSRLQGDNSLAAYPTGRTARYQVQYEIAVVVDHRVSLMVTQEAPVIGRARAEAVVERAVLDQFGGRAVGLP